jgi:hypothetical protein
VIGLITLDEKCAGARSAGNPHAACEAEGTGNGVTDHPTRARRGKPRTQPRAVLRATAPVLDPTGQPHRHRFKRRDRAPLPRACDAAVGIPERQPATDAVRQADDSPGAWFHIIKRGSREERSSRAQTSPCSNLRTRLAEDVSTWVSNGRWRERAT